jgi:hypothetical protein
VNHPPRGSVGGIWTPIGLDYKDEIDKQMDDQRYQAGDPLSRKVDTRA